jgi:NADH-quinone oxidoreductase subunit N
LEFSLPPINLGAIAPEIILVCFVGGMLMFDAFVKRGSRMPLAIMGIVGLALALAVSLRMWGRSEVAFSGMVAVDNYRVFFNVILIIGAMLTLLMSMSYIPREEIERGEYYVLILLATVGMMVMAAGTDLIMIFLGLELLSMCVYVLAGFARGQVKSNEAALKYFLLGAFASGFLLYGIAMVYGATGSTNLAKIAEGLASPQLPGKVFLMLGIGLLVVGFGFKVAMVPFHMWTPDVYEGAPTSVTAFMAIGVKAAAFAGFVRVFAGALDALHADWSMILWVLSVATMTVGNLVAISQNNIKRMLAYSSIAHAGYLLIGMVAGNELGRSSMLFYLLAYTFMQAGAFGVVIILGQKGEAKLNITDYVGVGYRYPLLGVAMAIFMFSLGGIPPTAGFVGKFYIFSAAIKAGYVWLVILAVINSAISLYYYLRVTVVMYMHEEEEGVLTMSRAPAVALVIILTSVATIGMGIFPSWIMEPVQKTVQLLLG